MGVGAAKFLMAGEPAEYHGSGRHRGIGADGPKAFTVDKPIADRFSNLGVITGRTIALGRVFGLHGGYQRSWSAGAITPLALRSGDPNAPDLPGFTFPMMAWG